MMRFFHVVTYVFITEMCKGGKHDMSSSESIQVSDDEEHDNVKLGVLL